MNTHIQNPADVIQCWGCGRKLPNSKFHMTKRIKKETNMVYIYKRRDCVDCRRNKAKEVRTKLREERKRYNENLHRQSQLVTKTERESETSEKSKGESQGAV